jgi:hypothetical protein
MTHSSHDSVLATTEIVKIIYTAIKTKILVVVIISRSILLITKTVAPIRARRYSQEFHDTVVIEMSSASNTVLTTNKPPSTSVTPPWTRKEKAQLLPTVKNRSGPSCRSTANQRSHVLNVKRHVSWT